MGKKVKLAKINYHLDHIDLLEDSPIALTSQILLNEHTQNNQSMTFRVSESTETSQSWQHEAGVEVTVGAEVEGGIPFTAKAKWSVDVAAHYTFTYETSKTETKTWEQEFPVETSPRTIVRAVASVHRSRARIPYTIDIVYVDGSRGKSTGFFDGVDHSMMMHSIETELHLDIRDEDYRTHVPGVNLEYYCETEKENVIIPAKGEEPYSLGNFEAGRIITRRYCNGCGNKLRAKNLKNFWLNQCKLELNGIDQETDEEIEREILFDTTPKKLVLSRNFSSLQLNTFFP